jgi:hypothetical protein
MVGTETPKDSNSTLPSSQHHDVFVGTNLTYIIYKDSNSLKGWGVSRRIGTVEASSILRSSSRSSSRSTIKSFRRLEIARCVEEGTLNYVNLN